MTFEQAAIVLLLAAMFALFVLDRFRMELVALTGLGVGIALGLVSPAEALSGFSNPAFVTVVEILLIVHVLSRSGILDPLARRIPRMARSETGVVALLCGTAALISVFVNNIGALALMIPVVGSVCRVTGIDQRRVLMRVSFAALLGGLCSIIGTPANLVVSNQLLAATGSGFAFLDYAWVGLPVAIAGLIVLAWPGRAAIDGDRDAGQPQQSSRAVLSEVTLPVGSRFIGVAPSQLDMKVHAVRRGGTNLFFQRAGTVLEPGDSLVIEIALPRLEALLADRMLDLAEPRIAGNAVTRIEAVVMPESTLVGSRIGALQGFAARGISVRAVASRTPRVEGSLADVQLSIGDVLYLSGDRQSLDDAIEETEILPLLPRAGESAPDPRRRPAAVFALGIALAATNLVAPEIAFGLVVLVLAMVGDLNLRRALADLDWSILLMLAAMIPLGFAIETTGAAATLAEGLVKALPAGGTLAPAIAILALSAIITPFVNNASTALVLGPIAISTASAVGVPPEPLLIAVALGASIDFLTPIGHHNNTLVMGLAGYRFRDFATTGWPVTLVVLLTATASLALFWA